MSELKPCPFCGGKVSRGVGKITENYFECQAHCEICGAEIRHKYATPRWIKNPEREAKRFISRMWNRRVGEGEKDG